ncbi:hypothetical protein FACS1894216_16380 [Synergistales bacterium]|nr:hypothetical protein FACS1894216_16380 [Synergistales bacterium]
MAEKKTSHVRGLRFSQELLEQVESVAHDEKRSFSNAAMRLIELGLEAYYARQEELERIHNQE